jgi:uncharacterized tellurite resistance protein B-like protein
MFKNLNEFFGGHKLEIDCEGQPNSHDLHVSVVVLCCSLAFSDGELETPEISNMTGTLFREFGLADHEAGELLELAHFLVHDKSKIDQFIEKIKSNFSLEQRQLLLSILWKVIISDGIAEAEETKLIAQLRHNLGLSIEQGVRARKLAEIDQIHSLSLKFAKPEDIG